MEFDRAKVVVLGDSGVGKSAFVHLLCYQNPLPNPTYTIGCNLEVKIHTCRTDSDGDRPYFVELWDVGGRAAHANTRSVYYPGAHGLILLYDCNNHKSQQNLKKWLAEFLQKTSIGSLESMSPVTQTTVSRVANFLSYWSQANPLSNVRFRSLDKQDGPAVKRQCDSPEWAIPVLVVGTKIDQLGLHERKRLFKQSEMLDTRSRDSGYNCFSHVDGGSMLHQYSSANSSRDSSSVFVDLSGSNVASSALDRVKKLGDKHCNLASEFGFPEIFVDSTTMSSLTPNSRSAVIVDKFLDDVVWTRVSKTIGFGSHSPDSLKQRRLNIDLVQASSLYPTTVTCDFPNESLF